jgi:hypothetical protein
VTGSILFIALCVVVVLCLLGISVVSIRRNRYRRSAILLESMRIVTVLAGLYLWYEPVYTVRNGLSPKPKLAILIDDSRSMATPDEENASKRIDTVRSIVNEEVWKESQKKLDIIQERLSRFVDSDKPNDRIIATDTDQPEDRNGDRDLQRVAPELGMSRVDTIEAIAGTTDLGQALESMVAKHPGIEGILLLSDGITSEGKSLVDIGADFRNRGIPIWTVPIGSSKVLPDLAIQTINSPSVAITRKPLTIPVQVFSSLSNQTDATIELVIENDGQSVWNEKQSVAVKPYASQTTVFRWTPENEGKHTIEAIISSDAGERIDENNRLETNALVKKESIRVLLIDAAPRWEYRYLRNALSRDPGVECDSLLFLPGLSQPGGGRKNDLTQMPQSNEAFSKYDVVLLGDVGMIDGQLTDQDCKRLYEMVEQQASGLIIMPGVHGFARSLAQSPLGPLLPIEWDSEFSNGIGSLEEQRFALTPEGRKSLLMQISFNQIAEKGSASPNSKAFDEAETYNATLWAKLPGFQWYDAVKRAKLGSSVLATHAKAKNDFGSIPLVVTRSFGTGKVLYLGTDSIWRWRKGVEDKYHYRFWSQMVRWMSYQRNMSAGKTMRVYYAPEQPKVNQVLTITAQGQSQSGEPLIASSFFLNLRAPDGSSQEKKLDSEKTTSRPDSTGWGVFATDIIPKTAGDYQLTIENRATDERIELNVFVQGSNREAIGTPANLDGLADLARVTRATSLERNNLLPMFEATKRRSEVKQTDFSIAPAKKPWTMAIFLMSLTLFWYFRKQAGML